MSQINLRRQKSFEDGNIKSEFVFEKTDFQMESLKNIVFSREVDFRYCIFKARDTLDRHSHNTTYLGLSRLSTYS